LSPHRNSLEMKNSTVGGSPKNQGNVRERNEEDRKDCLLAVIIAGCLGFVFGTGFTFFMFVICSKAK
jgi:hypothetical protein